MYTKQQLKLVEEEEQRAIDLEEKIKLEKQQADEKAQLISGRPIRRRKSRDSSASSSRSASPQEAIDNEAFQNNFASNGSKEGGSPSKSNNEMAAGGQYSRMAVTSGQLLEDILNEDNII